MSEPTQAERALGGLVDAVLGLGLGARVGVPPSSVYTRDAFDLALVSALHVLGRTGSCPVCTWERPVDAEGLLVRHPGSCRRSTCPGSGHAPR